MSMAHFLEQEISVAPPVKLFMQMSIYGQAQDWGGGGCDGSVALAIILSNEQNCKITLEQFTATHL